MRRPAAASMRSSRSTNRQASWRARSAPTVVFPEPMKPARQRIAGRGGTLRGLADCIREIRRAGKLIALPNANCTTERGEVHLREAPADRSEQAFCEFRGQMLETDRKSTRLNSSHTVISYAVFCLKKKKKK